jgi:hypothetical protein
MMFMLSGIKESPEITQSSANMHILKKQNYNNLVTLPGGRGAGVGRGLDVDAILGIGVALGVVVGVALGLADAVGIGV